VNTTGDGHTSPDRLSPSHVNVRARGTATALRAFRGRRAIAFVCPAGPIECSPLRWLYMPRMSGRTPGLRARRDHALPAAAVALFLLPFAFASRTALATHSTSTIGLLAIDANSEGNAAASLGPVNGCSRIEPGAQITVDYVVDAIPQDRPIIGYEAEVRYDSSLVEVLEADYKFLLGAVGTHQPFSGQSDQLPDSDGSFRMQVLDTASMTDPEANVERGPGVLARLTFRGKAAGLASIALAVSRDPLVYPVVLDTQNELIFVDRIGSASLAIGQDCPVEAQQPVIIDLAEVNEQIIADNPGLLGGSPPPEGTSSPSADIVTPEGQTPSPDESTPAPSPATFPCAAQPRRTPDPTPASPSPPPAEGAEATPAETPAQVPTPTQILCTPTPTPIPDQIVSVDDDSNMALTAGAFALLTAGSAAAGGGWYLYRRSRSASPGP
jgi:Cohesin domain